ncbi:MAG: lipid A biosynthesis acyltransferase [Thioalkalivibrio sp.]|nr:MAG: lipid A biosynthesis acyltransferase [Thioalkalivibrio sp.]
MARSSDAPTRHSAHPGNWTQYINIALLWLIARLPWRWAVALGTGLGRTLYHVARDRRYVVRRNLELCFPDLTVEQRERWVKENFGYTGRGLAELALGWFGGPAVDRIPCEFEGLEHLQSALQAGQPVILLSGHFCCIELTARLFGQDHQMAAIYKPIKKKPVFDQVMRSARERNVGGAVARTDIRGMLRHMKSGTPIWYAGDQHMKKAEHVFAPFFGVPTATTTSLPRLARLGKARVLPIFYRVAPGGAGYQITIGAPLEDYPCDDVLEDVRRMNEVLESAVRDAPTQYFWVHRRFKSHPEGTRAAYPALRSAHIGRLPWRKNKKKALKKHQKEADRERGTDDDT